MGQFCSSEPPFEEWEAKGVLDASNEGRWAGKAAKHVPVIVWMGGGKISVSVPHGMESDHYISCIWIKDEADKVLDYRMLKPSDGAASADFTVPVGTTVIAFNRCNQHDVWKSSALVVD
uniref:Desulfoferrodoxin ferrous iron-binding domain-containing protein n=1 Tax=Alexandrium catenella TaxID=2925 RepID=A0A7S1L226_ALECA|mmetsp:Transcript_105113/g.279729  ORF Transcript_105113/g.279729 Transcript_105113/m.279729 type:complete len:119 (+) Transcript_105113:81-437(+)